MGPDEYHDALPGARGTGPGRQRLHERDGRLDPAPGAGVPRRAAPGTAARAARHARHPPRATSRGGSTSAASSGCAGADDGVLPVPRATTRSRSSTGPATAERYGDISRLDRILEAEGDSTNRYKVSKQADVLMLFQLLTAEELYALLDRLGYPHDRRTIPRTIAYYLDRTCHGSTLSKVVHAWVLARSDRRRAWDYFLRGAGERHRRRRRAARPARASTWAPWPARSTCCSAGSPAWRPAATCSGFDPFLPDALARMRLPDALPAAHRDRGGHRPRDRSPSAARRPAPPCSRSASATSSSASTRAAPCRFPSGAAATDRFACSGGPLVRASRDR